MGEIDQEQQVECNIEQEVAQILSSTPNLEPSNE